MPQLDPNHFPSQLFWIIISFALFYLIMHFIIVPRISKIIHHRKHLTEMNETEAHILKLEIAELKAVAHKRLDEVNQEVQNMQAEAAKEFAEYSAKALADFNSKMSKKYSKIQQDILSQKSSLEDSSSQDLVNKLAYQIIAKITGEKYDR